MESSRPDKKRPTVVSSKPHQFEDKPAPSLIASGTNASSIISTRNPLFSPHTKTTMKGRKRLPPPTTDRQNPDAKTTPMRAAPWLVLLLCLHAVETYLFTRGFLLTLTELTTSSLPSGLRLSPCDPDPVPDPSHPGWARPNVDRTIILIVDALGSILWLQVPSTKIEVPSLASGKDV